MESNDLDWSESWGLLVYSNQPKVRPKKIIKVDMEIKPLSLDGGQWEVTRANLMKQITCSV